MDEAYIALKRDEAYVYTALKRDEAYTDLKRDEAYTALKRDEAYTALKIHEEYMYLSQNTRRKDNCLEDLGVDGIIQLKFILNLCNFVGRIHLAQESVGMQ
jgi:hypothetical protein